MLQSTQGIILSRMKYSESSAIVRIYTRKYGLLSFLEKGVRKAGGKKSSLLQILNLVEVVFNYRPEKDLQYSREINLRYNSTPMHTDMLKASLAFFMAELAYKTIGEREQNEPLFEFIENSIRFLNATDEPVANFHLIFATKLAALSGFGIKNMDKDKPQYFDMEQGVFSDKPLHLHFMDLRASTLLKALLQSNYLSMNSLSITADERSDLLEHLLTFYYLHHEGMQRIKSAEVLHEVFR